MCENLTSTTDCICIRTGLPSLILGSDNMILKRDHIIRPNKLRHLDQSSTRGWQSLRWRRPTWGIRCREPASRCGTGRWSRSVFPATLCHGFRNFFYGVRNFCGAILFNKFLLTSSNLLNYETVLKFTEILQIFVKFVRQCLRCCLA